MLKTVGQSDLFLITIPEQGTLRWVISLPYIVLWYILVHANLILINDF
jgi:hypothetical protein